MAAALPPSTHIKLDRATSLAVDQLARAVECFHPDDPPILARFVDDLRSLTGALSTLAAGTMPDGDAFAMSFGFTSGMGSDAQQTLTELDRWARSGARFGLYNPSVPEPEQRNRSVNIGQYSSILQRIAERREVTLGVDGPGLAQAQRGAAVAATMPRLAWMMRSHQLRSLVCDGPVMLAWVGAIDPGVFDARSETILARLVPALRRRLALERRLAETGQLARGFVHAVDALAQPAFLLNAVGTVVHANRPGARWLDRARDEVDALLADAAQGRATGFRVSALEATGMPAMKLMLWAATSDDETGRVRVFAGDVGLTPRETDVLAFVVRGDANKRIAAELSCSERTVEVHVTRLLAKSGVRSRHELIAKFWRR